MKILGCDYDGTLTHGGIDEAKLAAIEKWRQHGNLLGVVSGRGPDFMAFLKKEYNLSLDFFVAFNGGVIVDSKGKELYRVVCESVKPEALTRDLFEWGCTFAHVNTDRYYMVRRDKKDCAIGEYTLETATLSAAIAQISIEMKSPAEAAEIVRLVEGKYGDVLTPLQNGRCVDIVPKGVCKSYGVRKLQEIFSVEWADIIVVGDNFNDLDMIGAFYSYAMENGVDEVKKIATHITANVTDLIERELALSTKN